MPKVVPMITQNRRVSISKLDAAQRQLHQAIRLFFENADLVAVHTLAAAAHGIIVDTAKHQGKFHIATLVKPDHQKMFRDTVHKAQNFFKHADKDPDAKIEFSPARTHFVLFEAVYVLNLVGPVERSGKASNPAVRESWSRANIVFMWWFSVRYPEIASWPSDPEFGERLAKCSPDDLEMFRELLRPRMPHSR